MPPWVLDGGYHGCLQAAARSGHAAGHRAGHPDTSDDWENLYLAAGSPDRILLVEFRSEHLKPLTGKTLAAAARLRGEDPVDTIMNLIEEDQSRVGAVYFMMSDENLRKRDRAAVGVVRF